MSQLLLSRTYSAQPHHPANFSRKLPVPEVVYLPSVGPVNARGKGISRTLTINGTVTDTQIPEGKGVVLGSGGAGVYAPCIGASDDRFTVLISFIAGPLVNTKGLFQWATASDTSGTPYLLVQYGNTGIVRVFYASNYRISSPSLWMTEGRKYNLVVRGDGGTVHFYGNGIKLGSYKGSPTNSKTHVWFGNGYNGSLLGTTLLLGSVWTRDIGDESALSLTRNAWGMFEPSPARILITESGGASHTLVADSGSLSIAGTDANLEYHRLLAATQGSFAITGPDAALRLGRVLSADSAAITLSGTDASLKYDRVLQASSGSIGIDGPAASLEHHRVLSAETGSLQITGQDATLTYTQPGNYTLGAEAGSISVTGASASLQYHRKLSADAGEFAFTGTQASLRYARAVIAEAAQIVITGADATLTRTGGPEPITSTVARTAIFKRTVARNTPFQRTKSVTVRFN